MGRSRSDWNPCPIQGTMKCSHELSRPNLEAEGRRTKCLELVKVRRAPSNSLVCCSSPPADESMPVATRSQSERTLPSSTKEVGPENVNVNEEQEGVLKTLHSLTPPAQPTSCSGSVRLSRQLAHHSSPCPRGEGTRSLGRPLTATGAVGCSQLVPQEP